MGRLYICLHESQKHQPNVGIYSIHRSYVIGQPPTPFVGWVDESLWFLVYAAAPKSRRGAISALDSEPSEFPFLAGETGPRWGIWSGAAEGDFQKTYPDRPCRELCIFLLVSDDENPPNSPLDTNALRKGSSQVEGLPVLVLDAMEIMENAGFCV